MRLYELKIWGFTREIEARTAGKARYKYWLRFSDAFNLTFGEFLKKIKCRSLGKI